MWRARYCLAIAALLLSSAPIEVAVAQQATASGVHAVLEIDRSAIVRNQLERVSSTIVNVLITARPAINVRNYDVVGDLARVEIGRANVRRALGVMRSTTVATLSEGSLVFGQDGDAITARLTASELRRLEDAATTQLIEVLRRRLDPNGSRNVAFERLDESRLEVSAREIQDPQEMNRLIGRVGSLTFNLVDDDVDVAADLPTTEFVAQPFPGIGNSALVVEREPEFAGDQLESAHPVVDQQTGEVALAFQFGELGMRQFCLVTRAHVGKRFAILLDNQVLTAPVINEPICGGQGQISGSFTPESASELALMLNSGALPATVRIIEEGVGIGQHPRQ